MPRPVYIICARDVVQDKTSNLVSLFTVIEQVQVTPISVAPSQLGDPPNTIRVPSGYSSFGELSVIAVWLRLPEDEIGAPYEHEFVLEFSGLDLPSIGRKSFVFSGDVHLRRFILKMSELPPVQQGASLAIIRSRICREGGEWISQDYPLLIDFIDPQSTASLPESAPAEQSTALTN